MFVKFWHSTIKFQLIETLKEKRSILYRSKFECALRLNNWNFSWSEIKLSEWSNQNESNMKRKKKNSKGVEGEITLMVVIEEKL